MGSTREPYLSSLYGLEYLLCVFKLPAIFPWLLPQQKFVFLVEKEIAQYPIDFAERFGIDYSRNRVRPFSYQEVTRLIWHTQLATHNGGFL